MRALSKLFAVIMLSLPLAALAQTTVEAFAPTGTVKKVRQVTARFSKQVVPFGDLRLTDPFTVDCAEKGRGRWIDGRNWSYDFERDLPAGVRCSFTLKAGQLDVAGQPLTAPGAFSFDTGGPAIVSALPREGSQIDAQQAVILALDAPAREDTIAAHAYCQAEGVNERIGLRLVDGAEREQLLAIRKSFVERYLINYHRARGVVWKATVGMRPKVKEETPIVVVQCKRSFPAGANVKLVWGAGISTTSGIATAQAQTMSYATRPEFTVKFSCDRTNAKAACIPFLPMRLEFSAPIRRADADAIVITAAGGKRFTPRLEKEEAKADTVSWVTIPGPFPEQARLQVLLPAGLKDDAGRALLNAADYPLAVRTDEQPPLVKFPARFGIIEARGDRMLPVTLRNVEAKVAATMRSVAAVQGSALRVDDNADQQVIDWLKKMSGGENGWQPGELYGVDKSIFSRFKGGTRSAFTLPKPAGRRAFEVIGIPLQKPGFYVVELASPKLGAVLNVSGKTGYVQASALVTNLAAHFKHGAQSSLVWVTSLDKGKPVAKALVAVRDCAGKLLWQGSTDATGVAQIGQELAPSRCGYNTAYFISARSGADFTFTLSDWQGGIEQWRFNLPSGGVDADNRIASTVFDRSLLRAGETVHMKHFLRRHVGSGFAFVGAGDKPSNQHDWRAQELKIDERGPLPATLFLVHQGSDEKFSFPLQWNAAGSATTDWTIPATAKQGRYDVMVGGILAGFFRVEQFRVPTMKALVRGPAQAAVAPSTLDVDLQLNYLAGGAAAFAPVTLRTVVQDRVLAYPDYPDYSFGAADIKEGVEKAPGAFDDEEGEMEEQGEGVGGSEDAVAGKVGTAIKTQSLKLDKAGAARVTLAGLPKLARAQDLLAEMSYQDANGETLSSSTRIALWPSAVVVGIQPDGWLLSKDKFKFTVAVLDTEGKPVAGAPVVVDYFQRFSYAHRRRLMGGFYAYENSSEIKRLGQACEGSTDERGLLICEGKAPADGNLILRAQALDGVKRPSVSTRDVWVAGDADWWFKATDNDRIDLLPAKKRFEPDEEASFQVRSPFREATALITVEREGILDTYVRPLSGKNPVFTIPVKGSYAPNVFVSALVVRGRVASVQPTALVDLGKPAYKLGIVQMRVGWAAHELKVQVSADKPVYKVREKAQVKVKVTRADGSAVPPGAEVALAAVDVGLLELMPNTSWDLLEAMMQERALQVSTSTAQMQVIGKRHFGRKAFPAGGGGGKGGSRELFDTLLFWQARVVLDANGEASVTVPVNDSLTAFRIVAVASGGAGLFGTGKTDIRSSQDVMLLSGLPSVVREGDRLRAGFTLRNAATGPLTVAVGAHVAGQALAPQTITLAAGQAQDVAWDFTVPLGAKSLVWDVDAKAVDGAGVASGDKLRVTQKVLVAVPVRTLQATLLQLDKPQPVSMSVQAPADALAGRGGVLTTLSAQLGGSMPGVRDYMLAYPYSCFEQSTSRAVALHDAALWKTTVASLPAYLDGDGLVKYFALQLQGSDSLTAYILSVTAEAGYAIPADLKERMESALQGFVTGTVVRYSSIPTADLAVRKIAALEALSRSGKVQASMLQSFSIEPNLWPTSAVIDWYLVLQRSSDLPRREAQLAQVQQILKSRLNMQGTTMGFSTERSDDWWWLMASADVNANRLLLAMLDNPGWQADMGRLARGTIGRQKKGRWGTTLANAWGVLAMDKFSAKFESVAVAGSSSVQLGADKRQVTWAGTKPSAAPLLPWPRGKADLLLGHAGDGKPWATVQSLAAVPLTAPLSSGYRITKTITPVEQKVKGAWTRGDVYRVHLDLEAQADMTWVVVDDPIPASASVLGTGLGVDSQIMMAGQRAVGWVRPVFEERSFDAFRAYYEFIPKGKWSVEYTVRLNNEGRFNLPSTRVEAMYSPEMFGEVPNAPVAVVH